MRVTHSTSSTSETSACVEDEWQVQSSAALGSTGVPQQGLAGLSSDLGHCLTGCVMCLKDRTQEKATNHQPCQLLGVLYKKMKWESAFDSQLQLVCAFPHLWLQVGHRLLVQKHLSDCLGQNYHPPTSSSCREQYRDIKWREIALVVKGKTKGMLISHQN